MTITRTQLTGNYPTPAANSLTWAHTNKLFRKNSIRIMVDLNFPGHWCFYSVTSVCRIVKGMYDVMICTCRFPCCVSHICSRKNNCSEKNIRSVKNKKPKSLILSTFSVDHSPKVPTWLWFYIIDILSKSEWCWWYITANFLDFPPNFRLRMRHQCCTTPMSQQFLRKLALFQQLANIAVHI